MNRTSGSPKWSPGSRRGCATSSAAAFPIHADAEEILQEVFYELVEANRLLMPIEHVTGWLFRVARNRITDLFRKKRPESFSGMAVEDEDGDLLRLEDLLPSPDDGPDGLYLRSVLLDELELAINELPPDQREVFVAHEMDGLSFKEMAAETGVNVNTLLCAQTLCGSPPAPAPAEHSRGVQKFLKEWL